MCCDEQVLLIYKAIITIPNVSFVEDIYFYLYLIREGICMYL